MTASEIQRMAWEAAEQSARKQGLPARITDTQALRQVAAIIEASNATQAQTVRGRNGYSRVDPNRPQRARGRRR